MVVVCDLCCLFLFVDSVVVLSEYGLLLGKFLENFVIMCFVSVSVLSWGLSGIFDLGACEYQPTPGGFSLVIWCRTCLTGGVSLCDLWLLLLLFFCFFVCCF